MTIEPNVADDRIPPRKLSDSPSPEQTLGNDRLGQLGKLLANVWNSWQKPETVFWRLGWIFGLLFLVVTPPFQSADENWHFYRSYQLSEGTILATKFDNETVGGLLPSSLSTTVAEIYDGIKFHPEVRQPLEPVLRNLSAFHTPLEPEQRTIINFPQQALNSPISYLPQCFGIWIARVFGFSPLGMMYLARFCNLLAGLIITRQALKIMPLMKWGLVLLALSPMSVFLRSTMSPDTLLNACSFLLIAVVLRAALACELPTLRGELWLIGGLSLILTQCKPPYLFLVLLYFLIPAARYGGVKKYLTCFAAIGAVNLLSLVLWFGLVRELQIANPEAPNTIAAKKAGRPTDRLAQDQLEYLLESPIKRVVMLYWTTCTRSGGFLLESFVGILGWLDTFLPRSIIISYYVVLLLVSLLDGDPLKQLHLRQRLGMLVIFALTAAALGMVMYLHWAKTGFGYIAGLQGRYFIPLAPLLCLPCTLQRGAIDFVRWKLGGLVSCFLILALTTALYSLAYRYYIPPLSPPEVAAVAGEKSYEKTQGDNPPGLRVVNE